MWSVSDVGVSSNCVVERRTSTVSELKTGAFSNSDTVLRYREGTRERRVRTNAAFEGGKGGCGDVRI